MAQTITITLKAVNQASREIKTLTKDIGGLSGTSVGVSGLAKGIGAIGIAATAVAIGGIAKLTGAISDMAIAGISDSANLQQQVANIGAVMQATSEETDQLSNLIKDLGLDPTLVVDIQGAANAIETLAKSGSSLEDITGGMAKSVIQLANATGADYATAARLATTAQQQFSLGVEDMGQVVNTVAGLITNTKLGVNEVADAFGQAGGVAAQAGFNIQDFATQLAIATKNTSGGSDAGTALKTTYQRLIPTTNDAIDTMRDLGIQVGLTETEVRDNEDALSKVRAQIQALNPDASSYESRLETLTQKQNILTNSLKVGTNAFFDENGEVKTGAEVTEALRVSMANLTEQQRLNTLNTLFGSDAIRAAGALIDTTTDEYQKLSDAINVNTDASASAEARNNTLIGRFNILKDALQAARMELFDGVAPALQALVERWTPALIGLSELGVEVFGGFATEAVAKVNELVNAWADGMGWLSEDGTVDIQAMRDTVMDVLGQMSDLWDSHGKKIMVAIWDAFSFVWDVIKWSASLWGSVGDAIGALVDGDLENFIKYMSDYAGRLMEPFIKFIQNINWIDVGYQIMRGIAQGMLFGVRLLAEAARMAGQGALIAIKRSLGIRSPSAVFRDEVGAEIISGMVAGMNMMTPQLDQTASNIANSTVNNTNSAVTNNFNITTRTVNTSRGMLPSFSGGV